AERVGRDGEVACLDAAVRWVAERPLPLLAEHLHGEGVFVAGRFCGRVRSLAAAGAVCAGDQRVAPPDSEGQHDRARHHDPEQLRTGIPLDRWSIKDRLATLAEEDERVDEV